MTIKEKQEIRRMSYSGNFPEHGCFDCKHLCYNEYYHPMCVISNYDMEDFLVVHSGLCDLWKAKNA